VVLIVSLHALIPGQGIRHYAGEIMAIGGGVWLVVTWFEIRAVRAFDPRWVSGWALLDRSGGLSFVCRGHDQFMDTAG
jgi:hypothetical protein